MKDGVDDAYDVLIKGGTVYNGKSAEPVVMDIGIRGDKIAALGALVGKAGKTIDAEGLVVAPGFIDIHTHCDMSLMQMDMKRVPENAVPGLMGNLNYLFQGVTTVVTGNCGIGFADLDAWYELADQLNFGSNVYHLAPHGMLRFELFGKDQPRRLSAKQTEAFKSRVAQEMEKGAVGLSTGLEYVPGMLTDTEELVELAKVARRYGRLYATHVRDETGRLYPNDKTGAENSVEEAIKIGIQAEVSVQISHLKIDVPFNGRTASAILDPIETARSQGLNIHADQYPYTAYSTHLAIILPHSLQERISFKKKGYNSKEGRQEAKLAIQNVFDYHGPEKTMIAMYAGHENLWTRLRTEPPTWIHTNIPKALPICSSTEFRPSKTARLPENRGEDV
ncbi:MAG: amidohydrolase family protein [Proteobacteria bacterium]|nr:amidohydrolase family protein [Pseudomonadota bacterium]